MESLLRWSIENSTPLDNAPVNQPPTPRKDLDPAIIDMILGKPDSELMKEDLAVAVDGERSEDDRVAALDHLEMLIEQIDNANNLEKLKMWEPLQSLLVSSNVTPTIKMQTLWVIGTALQNNPAAQNAYLAYHPLPILTSFLSPSSSSTPQIRSKAMYALSGLLKHNAIAVEALNAIDLDGWTAFRDVLQDSDITVRRKAVFLLNTLLVPNTLIPSSSSPPSNLHTSPPPTAPETIHPNSHASMLSDPSSTSTSSHTLSAFQTHGLLSTLITGLTNPVPFGEDGDETEADADFEEKGVRLLHTYATACHGEFSSTEQDTLKTWYEKESGAAGGEEQLAERWGLSLRELKDLRATF